MTDRPVSRETLYARLDALAGSRETLLVRFDDLERRRAFGDAWAAHQAVVDRLAANREVAEALGWTSCALERAAGTGRLTAWGVPPGDFLRHVIPDWLPTAPARPDDR